MAVSALLFDFDGVLADTENIHVAAWERTLARFGLVLDDDACAPAAEVDDREFFAELLRARGIEHGDVEGWTARKQALAVELLRGSPRLFPGVAELIATLRPRPELKIGIVSTTRRSNIEAVLAASGLVDAFDVVIAREDVARPKPDPAGYLLALERLGVEARDAAALEDSAVGLDAARAAGLRVIAVGHRRPAGHWSGDAPYVKNLRTPDEIFAHLQ